MGETIDTWRPLRRHLLYVLSALSATVFASCDAIKSVAKPRELTPHERYAEGLRNAGLAESAMGREWLVAADTVLNNAHHVSLPFQESGYYDRSAARAAGWKFPVRDGQNITITIAAEVPRARVFVDLFIATLDTASRFVPNASSVTDSTQQTIIRYEAHDSATLVLRVQPELLQSGRFHITVRTDPALGFPVEGKGNAAAQSFWGVDRDGGRRSHQGVDIFAARGTPVLAATDGRIASLRSNDLGGNVVWQADEHRAQNLYCAHLDRHYVNEGAYVRMGDTIGFVGNTGNARTTAPHLHFGIYRRGQGPVDPWPYVRRNTATLPPVSADTTRLGVRAVLKLANIPLRAAPGARADTVALANPADTVELVGASSSFYRVVLANGIAGYIPSRTALARVDARAR